MTEPLSVTELMASLDQWAQQLDNASTRLSQALREYEGDWKADKWMPGPKLRWEEATAREAAAVWDRYKQDGKQPPNEKVRESRAHDIVKDREPQLYAEMNVEDVGEPVPLDLPHELRASIQLLIGVAHDTDVEAQTALAITTGQEH